MIINTKYNAGQEVKFYPFNDPRLRVITGTIVFIDIRASETKIKIEYAINDNFDGMKWVVKESDILEVK